MLKITESPYIKGFLAKLNLPIDKFTLLNCIKDGKKIDPAVGSGTLILALAHQIGEDNCTIYTQDISQKSSELLRLNLILNNLVHSLGNVIHGDTLLNPAHLNEQKNGLKKFDYIVSNPPFKMDFSETRDQLADDKFRDRFFAGVPNIPNEKNKMAIYLMFMQHIVYSLNEHGKAAIVVPTGFLTATAKIEKTIRETLVNNKWLRGVISMPSNVFATTGTNVSIIFIDKDNKSDSAILMDASDLGLIQKEGKTQKTILTKSDIEKIVDNFINKNEIVDFTTVVSYEEMKDKRYSFSAGQYFKIQIDYNPITEEEYNNKIQKINNEIVNLFKVGNSLENEIIKDFEDIKYE